MLRNEVWILAKAFLLNLRARKPRQLKAQEQEDVVQDGDSVNDGTTKGESTKEPVSKPVAPPKQKVGVWVSAKTFPTHTHIGTTKFNNFTKEYSYDWQLNNTLYSTFKKAIEQNSRFPNGGYLFFG